MPGSVFRSQGDSGAFSGADVLYVVTEALDGVTNESDVNLRVNQHPSLTVTDSHGPFHYDQSTDPGAVGAGKWWYDQAPSSVEGLIVRGLGGTISSSFIFTRGLGRESKLKRRNDADTGWTTVLTAIL